MIEETLSDLEDDSATSCGKSKIKLETELF